MSIQDIQEKINQLFADDAIFFSLIILLVGVTSFGLGRQSVIIDNDGAFKRELEQNGSTQTALSVQKTLDNQDISTSTVYVGSKNSDKYHLPWCPGAKQIAEQNKVYFTSLEEAKVAGYMPAGNCKGLQ